MTHSEMKTNDSYGHPSNMKKEDMVGDPIVRALSVTSKSSDDNLPTFAPPPYDQQSSSIDGFHNPVPHVAITVSSVFTIQARGTRFFRLPAPSSELEIDIYNGTSMLNEPTYRSIRGKRSSGSAVLHHAHRGPLLATNYRFGPGREPEIKYITSGTDEKAVKPGSDDSHAINVKSHCYLFSNRVVTLTRQGDDDQSDDNVFGWEYFRTNTLDGKRRVLALSVKSDSAPKSDPGKLLAVLVRTDATRTPGSSKCAAGNGGQLLLDLEATKYMSEELIIATCLMMLKKEIDRQRTRQFMIMGAAAGGGGG